MGARLQIGTRTRDLALFHLAIDNKQRGCDLVSLKVSDIAAGGGVRRRAMVLQHKTRKPVQFEITDATKSAVEDWIANSGLISTDWLFPCRKDREVRITTRQYARLVTDWIGGIGLNPKTYSTHSMRPMKVTMIYRKTGIVRAVQILLGHTKLDSTVRYPGVEVEDALALSEGVELSAVARPV
jgi:integrase